MKNKITFTIFLLTVCLFACAQGEDDRLYPFRSPVTGKVGYMNSEDKIIVPAIYSAAIKCNFLPLGIVSIGEPNTEEERVGLVNLKGEFILDVKLGYEFIGVGNYEDGLLMVAKNNKYGYVDLQNKVKIPLVYEDLEMFIDGIAAAKKNGKYGFVDLKENVVIDFKFDHVNSFSGVQKDGQEYAAVEVNKKWGFINKKGQFIIPPTYDYARNFNNGTVEVRNKGKVGKIDIAGKIIIPLSYDYLDEEEVSGETIIKARIDAQPQYEFLYHTDGRFIKKRKMY
ncbi:hypothetical protein CA265_22185 [Sphingobacteriaceae bacterium GW460-11-11-14-LB5]|nr:hypothetical protein CA265_22185 [Sphingobacteriaceae bacterium GW460-11-11-14-LB5]